MAGGKVKITYPELPDNLEAKSDENFHTARATIHDASSVDDRKISGSVLDSGRQLEPLKVGNQEERENGSGEASLAEIAEPQPVGNIGAIANSPHTDDALLPPSSGMGAFEAELAKCPQMPPNNTADSKALSDWWDFSDEMGAFDAGEWGDEELWRMEKKTKGSFIYVLRFVKTRVTRYGGTITPYIESRLAERRGRGRWQQSRKDASRLRCFAEHLAAELSAATESGLVGSSSADTARRGDVAPRHTAVPYLQGNEGESLPNVRSGFIN